MCLRLYFLSIWKSEGSEPDLILFRNNKGKWYVLDQNVVEHIYTHYITESSSKSIRKTQQ